MDSERDIRNKKNSGTSRVARQRMLLALLAVIFSISMTGLAGCSPGSSSDDAAVQKQEAAVTLTEPAKQTEADDAEPIATVFFASDYQQQDGWPAPEETLSDILDAVEDDGIAPDAAAFLGDYTNDPKLHDYQLSPEDSIEEIRSIIWGKCPDLTEDPIFVQGNHDKLTGSISESGLHEYDEFLIYVLNTENDFPWRQGQRSGCLKKVKRAAKEMDACFDELIADGETRPVFIAGHVPLHFTARTSTRHTTGDNLYASLIFDVVNEAADSLDIVYLFGHNHSKGWDCYMGGSCVYKAAGDILLVPAFEENDVSTDWFTREKLRFTYMNAGYTGYYMNCGPEELAAGMLDEYTAADDTLTGTVCEIYPQKLEIIRYDADGQHTLCSDGEADPYKNHIDRSLIDEDYYSNEVDSPQTVERKNR